MVVTVAVTVTVIGSSPEGMGITVTSPAGLSVVLEVIPPKGVVFDTIRGGDVEMRAGVADGVM